MSDTKKFTTRTASLKATKADIIKLDVKQLNINGEPLKSAITIKDERETITENDIWPNPINNTVDYLISDTDGNIVYQGFTNNTFDYSEMTTAQTNIIKTAVKVIDNKVLGTNDELLMNWDTAMFTNNGNSEMRIFGGDYGTKAHFTEWNSDLSNLTDGSGMFYCTTLETFTSDLSSLTSGRWMFGGCSSLTTFDSKLSSLTIGFGMFQDSAIESFNFDLSNLTNGNAMFQQCPNLTTFDSDLSSLTNGDRMFQYCKLDADSLNNIIHTLNDLSDDTNDEEDGQGEIYLGGGWGQIYIGLGYTNTDDSKLAIAKHCCCDTWDELNQEFSDKGWTIEWQFNGSQSASNVLNLLDDNETPSTIIWAKLEEVTDEKGHYGYVLEEDTSKHYNIYWFHDTNGSTEGYQQFGSLLEACGYFGVIPKEYSEQ